MACDLALKLLDADEACQRCGELARAHRNHASYSAPAEPPANTHVEEPRIERAEVVTCDGCSGECFDFRQVRGSRLCIGCVSDEVDRLRESRAGALNAAMEALAGREAAEQRVEELETSLARVLTELSERPRITRAMAKSFMAARRAHPQWPQRMPRAISLVLVILQSHGEEDLEAGVDAEVV